MIRQAQVDPQGWCAHRGRGRARFGFLVRVPVGFESDQRGLRRELEETLRGFGNADVELASGGFDQMSFLRSDLR